MLPWLKKQKDASASAPVESVEREPDGDEEFEPLETVAEELCQAIEKKDYGAIAEALRSAFGLLESEPHEEGEHT